MAPRPVLYLALGIGLLPVRAHGSANCDFLTPTPYIARHGHCYSFECARRRACCSTRQLDLPRMLLVSPPLSSGWQSLTILPSSDNAGGVRTLQGANYASGNNMTVENCISFCDASSFIYAGVCPCSWLRGSLFLLTPAIFPARILSGVLCVRCSRLPSASILTH